MSGYSSKASLLAAVDSYGTLCGLTSMGDKLANWRFTEKCVLTLSMRNIPAERALLKSARKELQRVTG